MTISTAQYLAMRSQLRAYLSGGGSYSASLGNPSDAELNSIVNQLLTDSSGASIAANVAAGCASAVRSKLGGALASALNPSDQDVTDFLTQLKTDASGASAPAAARYGYAKDLLRALLTSNTPGVPNPSLADALGYIANGGSVGFVATRTSIPESNNASTQSWMMRFATFARDNLSTLQIAWANWYADEVTPGANVLTLTASVEYPAGTFTQIKFGGLVTGTAAPGTTIWCDPVTIPGGIPNGSLFWVRFLRTGSVSLQSSASGVPDATLGEACTQGGTDQTMGGTVVGGANVLLAPCAILGPTTKRNFVVLGDSRQAGANDDFQAANGGYGQIGSGLNQYGYSVFAIGGHTAAQYTATHTLRDAIIAKCGNLTDVVNAYGTNDIYLNHTSAAALEAIQGTIRSYYPARRYFITTIDPETTSTDSFATLANQTTRSDESTRLQYNADVRANALGYTGYFDTASVTESSLNSGKWKVDGTANKYTSDGTHPSPFCYRLYSFSLP